MPVRRLPAEWEPQSGIMLTWPHDESDWKPYLPNVEPVYLEICRHASQQENLLIIARNSRHQRHIHKLLTDSETILDNIRYGLADSNDSWSRDHGPITVKEDEQPLLLDFQFNAWGEKYEYQLDNRINQSLSQQNLFSAPMQSIDLVLEGGSIDSNGVNTLLTNQCLLTQTRNAGLNQAQIESALAMHFGTTHIHWLHHGELIGDDTDAHIDTLARFVDTDKIAYVKCDDETDSHFQSLEGMEQELRSFTTPSGAPYQLTPLPLPDPVYNDDGQRLPATYANFLIINNAVLLPVYNQEKDSLAIDALQKCFPTREIIAINCLPLIQQFGSLHCITMQFPSGVLE